MEALELFRKSWSDIDVFTAHANRYKWYAKVCYAVMLVLGIAIATNVSYFATLAMESMDENACICTADDQADVDEMYQRNQVIRDKIKLSGQITLALSLATSVVAGIMTFTNPASRWQHLRSSALSLESEIWSFRTRTGKYREGMHSEGRVAENIFHTSLKQIAESTLAAGDLKKTSFYSEDPMSFSSHQQNDEPLPRLNFLQGCYEKCRTFFAYLCCNCHKFRCSSFSRLQQRYQIYTNTLSLDQIEHDIEKLQTMMIGKAILKEFNLGTEEEADGIGTYATKEFEILITEHKKSREELSQNKRTDLTGTRKKKRQSVVGISSVAHFETTDASNYHFVVDHLKEEELLPDPFEWLKNTWSGNSQNTLKIWSPEYLNDNIEKLKQKINKDSSSTIMIGDEGKEDITEDVVKAIIAALDAADNKSRFKTLDLVFTQQDENSIEPVISALCNPESIFSELVALNWTDCDLIDEPDIFNETKQKILSNLTTAVTNPLCKIKCLTLGIGDIRFSPLISSLGSSSSLTALDLSDTNPNLSDLAKVLKDAKDRCKLKHFVLNDWGAYVDDDDGDSAKKTKDKQIQDLSDALKDPFCPLKSLSMRNSKLGIDNVKSILEAIQNVDCKIVKLDLGGNQELYGSSIEESFDKATHCLLFHGVTTAFVFENYSEFERSKRRSNKIFISMKKRLKRSDLEHSEFAEEM